MHAACQRWEIHARNDHILYFDVASVESHTSSTDTNGFECDCRVARATLLPPHGSDTGPRWRLHFSVAAQSRKPMRRRALTCLRKRICGIGTHNCGPSVVTDDTIDAPRRCLMSAAVGRRSTTVRASTQRFVPFQLRLARLRVMYELRSIILRATADKGECSCCKPHLVVRERPAGAGQSGPGWLPRWGPHTRLQLQA